MHARRGKSPCRRSVHAVSLHAASVHAVSVHAVTPCRCEPVSCRHGKALSRSARVDRFPEGQRDRAATHRRSLDDRRRSAFRRDTNAARPASTRLCPDVVGSAVAAARGDCRSADRGQSARPIAAGDAAGVRQGVDLTRGRRTDRARECSGALTKPLPRYARERLRCEAPRVRVIGSARSR